MPATGRQSKPWERIRWPEELQRALAASPRVTVANVVSELVDMACGGADSLTKEVSYDLPDGQRVVEATVSRVRNGVSVNYADPYMRRRDPDSMLIADDMPTDKVRFSDQFGKPFADGLRAQTFDWLATQELAVFAFRTGREKLGQYALAVCPSNAAFFALGLALLQGITPLADAPSDFTPEVIIYVAPVFRHTFFNGKQAVVHQRRPSLHEIFSYNLYPGPSAKKGVYGALIHQGDEEGWVAAHCSAVQVVTPYDNIVTIMHEGASGGGKSEMLEQPHRQADGQLLLGRNLITGEKRYLEIPRTCELRPICDDMALCHPSLQKGDGRVWLIDAENGWFVRVNHINEYGTDPNLEKLTAQPKRPLLFLNIDAIPNSRALIWEHIEDSPGVRCPNPRVIIPRDEMPNVISEPVGVDIRSFGVRTPPCSKQAPDYGIIGLFHLLPPALGWLWRLVAPRGHSNPSIVGGGSMESEGIGAYWPFATGRRSRQANLLLEQIQSGSRARYILVPNQHVGVWKTGFMPQWLARDYLARRGIAKFQTGQIKPARSPLLGFVLNTMRIEGVQIPRWFLEVNTQPEVGDEAYDRGAAILREFFHKHLKPLVIPDLSKLGRRIIECCLDDGSLADYDGFLPSHDDYKAAVNLKPSDGGRVRGDESPEQAK